MSRVKKQPEERRNEIMDVAMELFNTKGYEQTAVSDIVRQIGVSQGTFYYYFKSKEEIADAVIGRSIAQSVEIARTFAEDPELSAAEKLVALFHKLFAIPAAFKGVIDYAHQEGNAAFHQKIVVQKINGLIPWIARIVQQGCEEGVFRVNHPKEVTEFLLVGAHFLLDPGMFPWNRNEFLDKVRALEEIVEKLLGTRLFDGEQVSLVRKAEELIDLL